MLVAGAPRAALDTRVAELAARLSVIVDHLATLPVVETLATEATSPPPQDWDARLDRLATLLDQHDAAANEAADALSRIAVGHARATMPALLAAVRRYDFERAAELVRALRAPDEAAAVGA